MTQETRETRLRRLYMRSIRRGIKEMDLILGSFAKDALHDLDDVSLDAYEAMLNENDQDLYTWVSGQIDPPTVHAPMINLIAERFRAKKN